MVVVGRGVIRAECPHRINAALCPRKQIRRPVRLVLSGDFGEN